MSSVEMIRRCLFTFVSIVTIPVMLVVFIMALVYYTIDAWIHPMPCKSCHEYGLGDCIGCEWLRISEVLV